jgi:Arc/MetJ-type ribon-helix-helix transcriptional regulator
MSALLVGHARCSTDQQDLTAQRYGLLGLGVESERIYVDHGLTDTNRERPGLREALAACRAVGVRTPRTHPTMGCVSYDGPMSTQIAVRLPDEMVAFLDRTVATGKASSRAALVAAAVEREMRRQAAEHDAEVLRENGSADDLDDLVCCQVDPPRNMGVGGF